MMLLNKTGRFITNRFRWLRRESEFYIRQIRDGILYSSAGNSTEVKRILLIAFNELTFNYLECFQNIFSNDSRIVFSVTDSPREFRNYKSIKEWCKHENISYLPFVKARNRVWDLMVFADHDAMDCFPVCVPKIRISHGIGGSKLVGGVLYRYDPKWIEYRGKVFYSRTFEPSEYIAKQAIKSNPNLNDIAVAVGDLSADYLLSLRGNRNKLRHSMGYNKDDFVILVQSTYGDSSLMERIGDVLIPECIRIGHLKKWKFIFQTHPHHWNGPYSTSHPFGNYLLQYEAKPEITIIRQSDDWASAMVASDMVITDHTSLAMMYALLGKPMLFMDNYEEGLAVGEPRQQLSGILPKLSNAANLENDIKYALEYFPKEKVAEIASSILSYPGEAVQRIRKEVYDLLGFKYVNTEKDGIKNEKNS